MKKLFKLILIFALVSCHDEFSKLDELRRTAGWKITVQAIDPPILHNGILITDVYAILEPCDKDDVIVFYENKTYVVKLNHRCLPTDPPTASGTYAYEDNAASIILDDISYELMEFSKGKFVIRAIQTIDAKDYRVTSTFTAV